MIGKINMIGKIKKFVTALTVLTVSLLIFTSCDESSPKKDSSSNSEILNSKSKILNLVPNPSFEEGKVFNSGLYEKGKSPLGKPTGWTTHNQLLNDSTGWSATEAHTGKRSLEIKNIGGTNSYWKGEPIIFKKPVTIFEASIWTKTKNIDHKTVKGKLQLGLDVYLKSGVQKKITVNIAKSDHDWEQTSKKVFLANNILKVVPSLSFSKGIGDVWFDDLFISPINVKIGRILFNSNVNEYNRNNLFSNKDSIKVYQTDKQNGLFSKQFIPVNPGKLYRQSGYFKSIGENNSKLYFGYACYSKNKKLIANTYIYTTCANTIIPDKWNKFTSIAVPHNTGGINNSPVKQFFKGTKYVKIVILPNYGKKSDEIIQYKNITLDELNL